MQDTAMAAPVDGAPALSIAPDTPFPSGQKTYTQAQANKTLARFSRACGGQADTNYHLAELAARYVEQYLGTKPGRTNRSDAVERLAREWLPHADEASDHSD